MMSFIQNCIRLGSRVSESCCDRLLCLTSLNRVFQSLFPSYYLYSWSPRDCATRPIRAVYFPECSRVCDKYIALFLISKKKIMYFFKYFSTVTSSCSEFTAWWKPALYLQYNFCFLHRYKRPWMELIRWSLLFYQWNLCKLDHSPKELSKRKLSYCWC